MGPRELIADMERVRSSLNPYNINRMTLAAGIAALESTGYFDETRHQIMETRAWTAGQLARRGFELTDSRTNFLFARTDRMEGGALYRALREKGVLVPPFQRPPDFRLAADYGGHPGADGNSAETTGRHSGRLTPCGKYEWNATPPRPRSI